MILLTIPMDELRRQAQPEEVERLYSLYADMIYRIAFVRTRSSSDSDDVLQDVFYRYIRSAPDFNDEGHEKAWFIRTALNCSNSLLTSAWKRRVSTGEDVVAEQMEHDTEVYSAVLNLAPKQRTAVHLYYYEGYKVCEIANLTGARESTVKSWLFRARDELRRQLKEDIDV